MSFTARSLAVLVALAACRGKQEPPLAPPPPAIQVQSAPAESRPVSRALPLTGTLVANQQSDVAANASGRVVKTFVERGALVKAGDPLVQLDLRAVRIGEEEAQANLQTSQAQRELADAQCRRNEALFKKGAISRDEWDRIATQCRTTAGGSRAAAARAELAKKNLGDATVRAPFGGMVSERFVSVGEYVQPQGKVASVVELSPLRLQLTVAEVDLGHVKEGQPVAFEVQAFPGETFAGKVRYIGPAVRAATRDLVVEAIVENRDRRLRPGMFATVRLRLPDEERPVVPKQALRQDGAVARLFTVVNGKIEERVVQVGPEQGDLVPVLDGLKAGEQVVTEITAGVRDGAPVAGAR